MGKSAAAAGLPVDPPLIYDFQWIIVGGESGGQARPMHPDWVNSLMRQAKAWNVPFLFKQWGEWAPGAMVPDERKYPTKHWFDGKWVDCSDDWQTEADHGEIMYRIGKNKAGRSFEGVEYDGYPHIPILESGVRA